MDSDEEMEDRKPKVLSAAVIAGMERGNINITDESGESVLSAEAIASRDQHQQLLRGMAAKKAAKSLALPTNDIEIRKKLRQLSLPVCFFGENPADRRDRLREKLAVLLSQGREAEVASVLEQTVAKPLDMPDMTEVERPFYSAGCEGLKDARTKCAFFSLDRAAKRIAGQKRKRDSILRDNLDAKRSLVEERSRTAAYKTCMAHVSEVGDDRGLVTCAFSPDSARLAVGSWTGLVKMWRPSGGHLQTLRGHTDRVSDVKFHPHSGLGQSSSAVNLVSSSADKTVRLWSLDGDKSLATLQGHEKRVAKIDVHPSGDFLVSSSFDETWRFWDLQTQQCLLTQTGHVKPVYCCSIHPDGSIVATGDLGGVGRIWDLRSGKAVFHLEGHIKQMLDCQFAPDGFHIATCSDDNMIKVHDLRQRKMVHQIAGHTKAVTSIRWDRNSDSQFLLSSSFDKTCKLWSTRDFANPIAKLSGHDDKIFMADTSPNGQMIATVSTDRTWKVWAPNSFEFPEHDS